MDVLEKMAEVVNITTADMLEIAASGGNGSEYVDIVGLMENAAKELREKDAKIEQLRQQNAELVKVLKLALSSHDVFLTSIPGQHAWEAYKVSEKARAAIAKATGGE